ncbi:MAG: YdeI/OmpD-associated family protein [Burkholderiales bacterium]|nr:YdeI/OmpD-associated family protein [Opitutaceae bacterium]
MPRPSAAKATAKSVAKKSAAAAADVPLRFTTTVVRLDNGMRYHVLPVPDPVVEKILAGPTRRLLATVNGHACKRALQTHADDGGGFLILGLDTLKEAGLKRGSTAVVELRIDPEPDALDMPEVFALVLEQDDAARARWETFTLGRRRSLLHFVTSAKQEATQIKRSWDLAEKIRTHTLYGDVRK